MQRRAGCGRVSTGTGTGLRQLLPTPRDVPLGELAAYAAELAEPLELGLFDPDVLAFCGVLATELRRRSADEPELAALAFWLRPMALARLRAEIEAVRAPITWVPRGTVFAIPPANVDTVFAYTWLLSLLLGNRTVLRVPSRAGTQLASLLGAIRAALAGAGPRVSAATVVVSYGHDDEVTAMLSSACDLRIVWGGDETVRRLRTVPLPTSARELSFGNRSALALLDADAVACLDPAGLADLARRFVSDAYPFDQRACSSPRAVVWRSTDDRDAEHPRRRFWAAVAAELGRRDAADPSAANPSAANPLGAGSSAAGMDAIATAADLVAGRDGLSLDTFRADLTVVGGVELADDADGWRVIHPGGGLFAETVVDDLAAVPGLVVRGDQTMTVFGVPAEDLSPLVDPVGRRGIDRVVPVGSALTFSRWWDGIDLVAELTRVVHRPAAVVPAARTTGPPAPRRARR